MAPASAPDVAACLSEAYFGSAATSATSIFGDGVIASHLNTQGGLPRSQAWALPPPRLTVVSKSSCGNDVGQYDGCSSGGSSASGSRLGPRKLASLTPRREIRAVAFPSVCSGSTPSAFGACHESRSGSASTPRPRPAHGGCKPAREGWWAEQELRPGGPTTRNIGEQSSIGNEASMQGTYSSGPSVASLVTPRRARVPAFEGRSDCGVTALSHATTPTWRSGESSSEERWPSRCRRNDIVLARVAECEDEMSRGAVTTTAKIRNQFTSLPAEERWALLQKARVGGQTSEVQYLDGIDSVVNEANAQLVDAFLHVKRHPPSSEVMSEVSTFIGSDSSSKTPRREVHRASTPRARSALGHVRRNI